MNPVVRNVCAVWLLAVAITPLARAGNVHHYIFVGMDREKLAEPGFLDHKGVEGVQVKYTWRQLEPEKDNYAFDDLRDRSGAGQSQREKTVRPGPGCDVRARVDARPEVPA